MFFAGANSFAGVAGTKHDMYFLGKGTDQNVCSYCHIPHNAAGEKIWSNWTNTAELTSGVSSPIGNLCYTCHDGTTTDLGAGTVFDIGLQQHKISPGSDCNFCHSVHDNTNGMFMNVAKTQSADTESATYCETCHDATMPTGAQPHGDHLAGSEHPYKDSGPVLDTSCNACHQMHGAVNNASPTLTNPILRFFNIDSGICTVCHVNKISSITGTAQHPAILSTAGTWGKVLCSDCHDIHQPNDPGRPAVLKDTNVNSAYCTTCHKPTDTTKGPAVGTYSHPAGAAFTTIGATPSADTIDDDSDGAADYPGNSAVIACESCHSVHDKGVAKPLLRIQHAQNSGFPAELCLNCHSNFTSLTNNTVHLKHNMPGSGKGTDQNVCNYCHIPHNAAGEKIWSTWGNEAQLVSGPSSTIGNMCYTCHDGTVTNIGQSTTFNASLQQHKIPSGQDCDMCHSVHDNTNGMFMNVPITQNFYCASCHNAVVNGGGFGDMMAAGNHPSYWPIGSPHPDRMGASCNACHHEHTQRLSSYNSCGVCHEVHAGANYSTPNAANPILRINNTDSVFCASCHPNKVQGSTSGTKHPANLTSGGNWGKVECMACHNPHQPANPSNPAILRQQNVDSSYCTDCHDLTDTSNGPKIGNGHPVNVPFSMTPVNPALSPAGNAIDDNAKNGIDYPANSSNVICETCHSIHRKGVYSPLLRMDNSGSALCLNCHQM